ncbi:MAG TPA: 2-isopropylmalate synthase, partial [Actinomycetota bacterium]
PELVGQAEPVLVLGKGSGIDSVVAALERLGLTATDEQALAILDEVKARSLETKGLVDDEAFTEIVQRITS